MEAAASSLLAQQVCLLLAMCVVTLTTWIDRPERPPATASQWEVESFASLNRQFHLVMAIHTGLFLFTLTMVVVS